jgi:hypothetical protein
VIGCEHWEPNHVRACQSLQRSTVTILDHQLVKLVARRLGTLTVHGPKPKPKLMEAIADRLPLEVVHRSKMEFTLPLRVWSYWPQRGRVEAVLRDSDYEGPAAGQLDSAAVATVRHRFLDGPAEWIRSWSLYALKTEAEALPSVRATASTKPTP